MHRETITCAARLLLRDSHLNTSISIDQAGETLYFAFDMLTQPGWDIHLFPFDDDLHGLPSLSNPTIGQNQWNGEFQRRDTKNCLPLLYHRN